MSYATKTQLRYFVCIDGAYEDDEGSRIFSNVTEAVLAAQEAKLVNPHFVVTMLVDFEDQIPANYNE